MRRHPTFPHEANQSPIGTLLEEKGVPGLWRGAVFPFNAKTQLIRLDPVHENSPHLLRPRPVHSPPGLAELSTRRGSKPTRYLLIFEQHPGGPGTRAYA